MLTTQEYRKIAKLTLLNQLGKKWLDFHNIDYVASYIMAKESKCNKSKIETFRVACAKKGCLHLLSIRKREKRKLVLYEKYKLSQKDSFQSFIFNKRKNKEYELNEELVNIILCSKCLLDDEKQILKNIFINNMTNEECGKLLCLSKQMVNYRIKNALSKLKVVYKTKENVLKYA